MRFDPNLPPAVFVGCPPYQLNRPPVAIQRRLARRPCSRCGSSVLVLSDNLAECAAECLALGRRLVVECPACASRQPFEAVVGTVGSDVISRTTRLVAAEARL